MSDKTDDLLRIMVQVTGRAAFPNDQLRALVAPAGARSEGVIRAYNLCNGARSQRELAKAAGLDEGNLSKAVKRWEQAGIVFRVGGDGRLLHLYPLN
jgi:DNA-binding MarR family transcriptional regulator